MHLREVIASGNATLTDTLHLLWTFIHLIFILIMIWFGAAYLKRRFRLYTIFTVLIFLLFGLLTSIESKGIESGQPTPYIGLWERLNMLVYMTWIIVFAISLLRKKGVNGFM